MKRIRSKINGLMACCLVAVMFSLPVRAGVDESSSFSPVFVKDGGGALRELTWKYEINGGQPLTVEDPDGDMTIQFSDITLAINPAARTRQGQFSGTISGAMRGSVTAKFSEALETLVEKVCVTSEQVDMRFDLSAEGQTLEMDFNLVGSYSPSVEWFLDRADLDELEIGYQQQQMVQTHLTGEIKLAISGEGSETVSIDENGPAASDKWTIIDKLDQIVVSGRGYPNVVVVRRDTVGFDAGEVEPMEITYWVAQGVGMVKGIGQYDFQGTPLSIELKSSTLKFPPQISVNSGYGGSVSPSALVAVNVGGSKTFTAFPDTDYAVDVWTVNTVQHQVGGNSFTLSNVQADAAVSVSFKLRPLLISVIQPSNGSITPASASVSYNGSQTFVAMPDIGYEVDAWKVNNVQQQSGGNSFSLSSVQADASVSVSFKLQTMQIAVTQPSEGAISQDPATVLYGGVATFTAEVPSGYRVQHWLVNDEVTAADEESCTVEGITSSTAVSVVFERIPAMPWLNLLLD